MNKLIILKMSTKYLKMIMPIFGTFTNRVYDIIGIMWFGRLHGKCVKSKYENIINVGSWKNLPQYHLKSDIIPQFYKKYE